MKLNLKFVVDSVHGTLLSDPVTGFADYAVDNRSDKIKGSLFIPLKGEAHDAHDFVAKAIEAGASGVLCHQWRAEWEAYKSKVSFIQVDDTLAALTQLSSAWRDRLQAKIIGLSGSNGKTTSKDFLSQILAPFGETSASKGSFNNHWGVPFTLLDCSPSAHYCVVEMGMNHSGELSELAKLSRPHVVGLTNVGRAHIGNFKDGIQGVARAKEELFQAAPADAILVFNLDNNWVAQMMERYPQHKKITFSLLNSEADVFFHIEEKTRTGFRIRGKIMGEEGKTDLSFWGEQNVENLALAASLASGAGLSSEKIWQQLPYCHTGWGRNQWINSSSGAHILFDGYNANPESFKQLLANLESTWDKSCRYHAVFSEMRELGEQSLTEHQELGRRAGTLPWSSCLFIGPSKEAFMEGWKLSKNKINPVILGTYEESLAIDLSFMLDQNSQIIVKGSRGGALERLVSRLKPQNFTEKK